MSPKPTRPPGAPPGRAVVSFVYCSFCFLFLLCVFFIRSRILAQPHFYRHQPRHRPDAPIRPRNTRSPPAQHTRLPTKPNGTRAVFEHPKAGGRPAYTVRPRNTPARLSRLPTKPNGTPADTPLSPSAAMTTKVLLTAPQEGTHRCPAPEPSGYPALTQRVTRARPCPQGPCRTTAASRRSAARCPPAPARGPAIPGSCRGPNPSLLPR